MVAAAKLGLLLASVVLLAWGRPWLILVVVVVVLLLRCGGMGMGIILGYTIIPPFFCREISRGITTHVDNISTPKLNPFYASRLKKRDFLGQYIIKKPEHGESEVSLGPALFNSWLASTTEFLHPPPLQDSGWTICRVPTYLQYVVFPQRELIAEITWEPLGDHLKPIKTTWGGAVGDQLETTQTTF